MNFKLPVLVSILFSAITFCADKETPVFLYKIISPENWEARQLQDKLALTDDDALFIHLATEEQLPRILEKYWRDKEYIVLKVNTAELPGNLILEANRPDGDEYYHLYNGHIPIQSAISVQ